MERRDTMRVAILVMSMVLLASAMDVDAAEISSPSSSVSEVLLNKACGVKCALKCILNPRYQTCYNHCMYQCKHPPPGDRV